MKKIVSILCYTAIDINHPHDLPISGAACYEKKAFFAYIYRKNNNKKFKQ